MEKPTRVVGVGTIEYRLKDGTLHREDGPALCRVGSSKEYYLYGLRHRENGPAVEERVFGNKTYRYKYYFNGKLHRPDGPAIIQPTMTKGSEDVEWWLNGRRYTEKGFWEKQKDTEYAPMLVARKFGIKDA
jgi:hypothetical protein